MNVKAEVHKLDFDPVIHANLQSQIRMKRHVESRKQSLDKDLAELEKVKERLPQFKEKVSQLMDQLDTESYGAAERQALKELGKKLETRPKVNPYLRRLMKMAKGRTDNRRCSEVNSKIFSVKVVI